MQSIGVPPAAAEAALRDASPSLSIEQVECISALNYGGQLESVARELQESGIQRSARLDADQIALLRQSPGRLESLQAEWLRDQLAGRSTGAWESSVSIDKMHDTITFTTSAPAPEVVVGWLGQEAHPRLVARCKQGRLSLFVQTGLASSPRNVPLDKAYGKARLDYEKPQQFLLGESTDYKALFFPDAGRWIRGLSGSSRLVFEFIPLRSSPAVVEFPTKGFDQIAPLLERACTESPWLPPAPAADSP